MNDGPNLIKLQRLQWFHFNFTLKSTKSWKDHNTKYMRSTRETMCSFQPIYKSNTQRKIFITDECLFW